MGQHIVLGSTDIAVTDQELSTGYQEGYQRFLERYQGKPLTDIEVYGFLVRNTLDILTTDRYRAGYVLGWCAALHGQGRPGATVGYSTLDPQPPVSSAAETYAPQVEKGTTV